MQQATIQRPVTVAKLADVLAAKPYQINAALIRRSISPSPSDAINDSVAIDVAAMADFVLKIIDDEDGGASELGKVPVLPAVPPSLTAARENPNNFGQPSRGDDEKPPN